MSVSASVSQKNNFNVIVTGSTGFIGLRLLKILPKYYDPKCVLCLVWDKDSDNKSKIQYIKNLGYSIKFVDLTDITTLKDLPINITVVFHLAANTNTSQSDHRVNDIGTKNLLNSLKKLNSNTKFIYASTVAMFAGRRNCSNRLTEKSKYCPTNKYGRTKMLAEKFLIQKSKNNKFQLICPRITTVYGKNARSDSMFPMLIKRIINNSISTKVNWPGRATFIHVDDCAKAILELSRIKVSPGKPKLFFLGTETFSIYEVTKMIYEYKNIRLLPIKLPNIFWNCLSIISKNLSFLENYFEAGLYNWIWRFGLLIDNVTWCDVNLIWETIPKWKQKKLCTSIHEL